MTAKTSARDIGRLARIAALGFAFLASGWWGWVPIAAQGAPPPKPSLEVSAEPDATAPAELQRFRAEVEATLNDAHANTSYWGVAVVDRDTGQKLYDLNADRYFTPASNAKIITTAFALATLGPDFRYRTTLESAGELHDGKLRDDLILLGRGDPDLSNRKFPFANKAERDGPLDKVLAEMADAAVAKGLREVEGDILADDSYLPYDPYPAGWSAGDLFFSFGAPVSAIAFNENTFSINVRAGVRPGERAIVTTEPAAAQTEFGQEITTSAAHSEPDFSVVRQPGKNFILVRGTIPVGHAPVRLDFAMSDPAEEAAATLKQLLEARGVRISGVVRVRHAPPPQRSVKGLPPLSAAIAAAPPRAEATILAEHLSPPLIESVRLTNKISQNLHAELFLRTTAREKTGDGSIDRGLQLEQDFLRTAGVADGDILLSDGSGLARDDLVKPSAMVQLLLYAARQPWGPAFISTLPVAGVDGTIEGRMKDPAVSGLVQAKTGSFEHVHALSGYATSSGGEHLVFSIFVNNDPEHGRDATEPMDALVSAIVQTLGASAQANKQK
jgi:D-alanyl-D-alanine carboxypeptidase/D-alanyl-D-alanine-endopeptidase (penicillin-binding protein 4)